MPRSLQEILDNPEAYAAAFEAMGEDHSEVEIIDAAPLRRVLAAARARQRAEQEVLDAVREARQAGLPWMAIGSYLGTSGEAARQRYSALTEVAESTESGSDEHPGAVAKAETVAKQRPTTVKKVATKKAAPKIKMATAPFGKTRIVDFKVTGKKAQPPRQGAARTSQDLLQQPGRRER
jgi:hypothetical protein